MTVRPGFALLGDWRGDGVPLFRSSDICSYLKIFFPGDAINAPAPENIGDTVFEAFKNRHMIPSWEPGLKRCSQYTSTEKL